MQPAETLNGQTGETNTQSTSPKAVESYKKVADVQAKFFQKPCRPLYKRDFPTTSRMVVEIRNKFFPLHPVRLDGDLFRLVGKHIEELPKTEIEHATHEDIEGLLHFLQAAWSKSCMYGDEQEDVRRMKNHEKAIGIALWNFFDQRGRCGLLNFPGLPGHVTDIEDDEPPPAIADQGEADDGGVGNVHTNTGPIPEEDSGQHYTSSHDNHSNVQDEGVVIENVNLGRPDLEDLLAQVTDTSALLEEMRAWLRVLQ